MSTSTKKLRIVLKTNPLTTMIVIPPPAPKPEKTYYLAEGMMDSEFFKTYLEDKCAKGFLQRIRKYWKDVDEEEGEGLEYRVFSIPNANDRVVEYTECWLLDNEGGYVPIIVTGINTSSCYAARRCGMDREWEEGDDVQTQYTLDEIADLMIHQVSNPGFCEMIQNLAVHPKYPGFTYLNPYK